MHPKLRFAMALATSLAATQTTLAASASITVDTSKGVVVTPARVTISNDDRTATYTLDSSGYTIISLAVAGGTTRARCTVAAGGQSGSCTKTGSAPVGELAITLVVKQNGGGVLPSPNTWLQAD